MPVSHGKTELISTFLLQVLVPNKGAPGSYMLMQKCKDLVQDTPQGQIVIGSAMVQKPQNKTPQRIASTGNGGHRLEYLVTPQNVDIILSKALASNESMTMLLKSLKDDLRRIRGSGPMVEANIRMEVSKKVRRALEAQEKTFSDLSDIAKRTAAPKAPVIRPVQQQRPVVPKPIPFVNATPKPAPAQDSFELPPHLAGMNIGKPIPASRLNAEVGSNVVISKETVSSKIQLVTLSNGRVLAVQLEQKNAPRKSEDEVLVLDSSDEDDSGSKKSPPKVDAPKPSPKPYRPGPKCSKMNRPGPKSSKISATSGSDSDAKASRPGPKCSKVKSTASASDSEGGSKKKFKMRVSLGGKEFPKASEGAGHAGSDSDASMKDEEKESPLKSKDTEKEPSEKEREKKDTTEKKSEKGKETSEAKDDKETKEKSGESEDKENKKEDGEEAKESKEKSEKKDEKKGDDEKKDKDGGSESKGNQSNKEPESKDETEKEGEKDEENSGDNKENEGGGGGGEKQEEKMEVDGEEEENKAPQQLDGTHNDSKGKM